MIIIINAADYHDYNNDDDDDYDELDSHDTWTYRVIFSLLKS